MTDNNNPENNTPAIPSDFNELMRPANPEISSEEEPVLRCNRCGTPITPKNSVLTETGYRCKDCIRGHQQVFDSSKPGDAIIAFFISAIIAFAGSWLVKPLQYIVILVATGLGMLIFNATRLALKRRRGKKIDIAVLIGAILGGSPLLIRLILQMAQASSFEVGGGVNLLFWHIVYVGLVAASAYAQSRGARR